MLNTKSFISVASITAVTVVALTALIINSEGKFNSNWSKEGGSLTIEGRPSTLPSQTE